MPDQFDDKLKAISFLRGHDGANDENVRALVRLLRSDGPLDQDVRHSLALMFDPMAFSAFKVERRNNGNPMGPVQAVYNNFALARETNARIKELEALGTRKQGRIKKAVTDIAGRHGLSVSAIEKARAVFRKAIKNGVTAEVGMN